MTPEQKMIKKNQQIIIETALLTLRDSKVLEQQDVVIIAGTLRNILNKINDPKIKGTGSQKQTGWR